MLQVRIRRLLPCVFGMSTRYSSRKSIGSERDKDLIIPRIHTRTRAHAGAHAMSKKSTTRPPIPLNRQRYNGLTGGRWLCPDALRPPFDHQLTNYWAHSYQIQPTFLSTTDHLSTIGYHLGYEHQSHFCTAFKRKYGVSPSLFRDQQNKVLASAPTSRLEVYDDVGREV